MPNDPMIELERDALEQIESLRKLVISSLLTMLFALFSSAGGLALWASNTHDEIRREVALVREGAAGEAAQHESRQRDVERLESELSSLERRFDDRLRAQEQLVSRLETLVEILSEVVGEQSRGRTQTTPMSDNEA